MKHPVRKPNRPADYDYSLPGAYFITICTENRKNLFWEDVGASIARPEDVVLSAYGRIVALAVENIPKIYPAVCVDCYAIMPNHIHLLLQIQCDEEGRPQPAPCGIQNHSANEGCCYKTNRTFHLAKAVP